MDINCALKCTHQKNGKCRLSQPKSSTFLLLEEPTCPYFEKTVPHSSPTR